MERLVWNQPPIYEKTRLPHEISNGTFVYPFVGMENAYWAVGHDTRRPWLTYMVFVVSYIL